MRKEGRVIHPLENYYLAAVRLLLPSKSRQVQIAITVINVFLISGIKS